MNLPEPRALPAGRHQLRREHLLREISRDRPRAISRRVLSGVGAVVLAGSGLAAAASAGVLPGSDGRTTHTVACFARASTEHVSVTVVHPRDPDPVHVCQMMWSHRMVNLQAQDRPVKTLGSQQNARPTPPSLVACALSAQHGRSAPVGVFPGTPGTCQSLGLLPVASATSTPS